MCSHNNNNKLLGIIHGLGEIPNGYQEKNIYKEELLKSGKMGDGKPFVIQTGILGIKKQEMFSVVSLGLWSLSTPSMETISYGQFLVT
jgi:hypothetical protein